MLGGGGGCMDKGQEKFRGEGVMDSFGVRKSFEGVGGERGFFYSLQAAESELGSDVRRFPLGLKIVLENLLRHEDGRSVKREHIERMMGWLKEGKSQEEIAYRPSRVLMQDFTGVPAVADLAAMRDKVLKMGGRASHINPQVRVDLVIDHSVVVDRFGDSAAFGHNIREEFKRNRERYEFLKWGQSSFENFRVVPPGTGICHQVNLEYLAEVVWQGVEGGDKIFYPDTVIGTDSHTTMVNALGVLGWGVGGIEAEAAMLGQPVSMMIPEVIGVRLDGSLREGVTATDLVLEITHMLRSYGVVGKFVEFYGPGLSSLSLADRATISNMAPEYGASCGLFPVDKETMRYLELTARRADKLRVVEAYMRAQGMWSDGGGDDVVYTDRLDLDLSKVESMVAGPKRPQDKIVLGDVAKSFGSLVGAKKTGVKEAGGDLRDGDVVIAAITSCTNTSNPNVLVSAGLLARNALRRGLSVKGHVKTSLAPGSQVVTDYLRVSGLDESLKGLGFDVVGYGCTTCIGNSGPLSEEIASEVREKDLTVAAVLSGNRNFEGRVHPLVKANYLASPPLVIAYALAGNMGIDIVNEPLGVSSDGESVYLRDIWPSNEEISDVVGLSVRRDMFASRYADVFEGSEDWRGINSREKETYDWNEGSTYVRRPPFFDDMGPLPESRGDIEGARSLLILGDSVTTDHISPAGSFGKETPAGDYLLSFQVRPGEFNSYGSRRGNHEVMLRGTFANVRIRNQVAPETEGGFTRHYPSGEVMSVFDASERYRSEGVDLVVIGGKEYGTGSSRDWAAKGTRLLGVRAVIAESFERIHRSNLVGMGILPLQFLPGEGSASLGLDGSEVLTIRGIDDVKPKGSLNLEILRASGEGEERKVLVRIDTEDELSYFRHNGILPYVLRNLMEESEGSRR